MSEKAATGVERKDLEQSPATDKQLDGYREFCRSAIRHYHAESVEPLPHSYLDNERQRAISYLKLLARIDTLTAEVMRLRGLCGEARKWMCRMDSIDESIKQPLLSKLDSASKETI